jgi:hypothetical protein
MSLAKQFDRKPRIADPVTDTQVSSVSRLEQDKTWGGCMKRITANITSLVALVLLLTATGYSQFMQQVMLKADVPFEFSVGKKTFPAGEYLVVRIAPHTLTLRDTDNRVLATFVTAPAFSKTAHATPVLRFESAGGQYVLTQIWPGNATTGYELSVSKRTVFLARQEPANKDAQAAAPTPLGK